MFDQILKMSCDMGRIITIVYQSGNTITKRNIRVLSLHQNEVRAFCYLRNQSRIFKKDRILAADLCRKAV